MYLHLLPKVSAISLADAAPLKVPPPLVCMLLEPQGAAKLEEQRPFGAVTMADHACQVQHDFLSHACHAVPMQVQRLAHFGVCQ